MSLLPTCGKNFKNILFNNMFIFLFLENKRIIQKYSSFKLASSWIIQLLSITHEIYQSSDDRLK